MDEQWQEEDDRQQEQQRDNEECEYWHWCQEQGLADGQG